MARIAFAGVFTCRLAEPVSVKLTGDYVIVWTNDAGVQGHRVDADVRVPSPTRPQLPGWLSSRLWPIGPVAVHRSTAGIATHGMSAPALAAGRPSHELPTMLMTPHVSGWAEGMLQTLTQAIVENTELLPPGQVLLSLAS
jgi:hypothetical protein